MGTWGTAILSNDTAADVAAEFKDSIAYGKSIEEAEDQLIADFCIDNEVDPYALCPFWLGLAYKQVKMGRLSERTKANAFRTLFASEFTELGDKLNILDRRELPRPHHYSALTPRLGL